MIPDKTMTEKVAFPDLFIEQLISFEQLIKMLLLLKQMKSLY